jgi:transcriptional regulator with XRE-family HTH domain
MRVIKKGKMKFQSRLTDEAVRKELGARLEQRRIELSLTQAELAERAGIGKRTLERLEAGQSVQLTTLIRTLRELDLLENLNALIPEAGPRPMDLLKLQGKRRKRAYSPRGKETNTNGWKWGDEE